MEAKFTKGPWFLKNGNEIHDKNTLFDESGARVGETPNLIATVDNSTLKPMLTLSPPRRSFTRH